MRNMEITPITLENRSVINEFLMKHWYSTDMVVCGEKIDMTKSDGLAVFSHGEITALLTYRIKPDHTCEIISLDSLIENREQRRNSSRKFLILPGLIVSRSLINNNHSLFPSLYAISGYWLCLVIDGVPHPRPRTIPWSWKSRYLTSVW